MSIHFSSSGSTCVGGAGNAGTWILVQLVYNLGVTPSSSSCRSPCLCGKICYIHCVQELSAKSAIGLHRDGQRLRISWVAVDMHVAMICCIKYIFGGHDWLVCESPSTSNFWQFLSKVQDCQNQKRTETGHTIRTVRIVNTTHTTAVGTCQE